MSVSVLDIFRVGIGPSSSHTVGPMRAANLFACELASKSLLRRVNAVKVELFGSLGATGKGHGSDKAIVLGLMGKAPDTVDIDFADVILCATRSVQKLNLLDIHEISFFENDHLLMRPNESLPRHPNGMRFCARSYDGEILLSVIYYSIGGGFVVDDRDVPNEAAKAHAGKKCPYPFQSAEDLLTLSRKTNKSFSALVLENESAWRSESETRTALMDVWAAMQACVARGCSREGVLPGALRVKRRAAAMSRALSTSSGRNAVDPLNVLDWVSLYALAVNEENACGGRVVTAPTNGAAGIIPAVLLYYFNFVPGANLEGVFRFLLTAGAIGILYKQNASISGAEVGCQGEVGVACSMAAGALAEVLGGSPAQVENAAEIGMEHNLGLTCDPVGGLVQVPCIERNAMGAIKAINAARLALRGDGQHLVSLDEVIKTMRDTGADMQTKYKETSRGGLALNVIPVSVVEC